jgi:hypothetical protein
MAVLVDALIFLVAMTLLIAVVHASSVDLDGDDGSKMLRSYHSVMLSGQMPGEDGSSMSSASLSDYLIALSLSGAPDEIQVHRIEKMVNGTLAELEAVHQGAWLVIELGPTELHFGSPAPEAAGDVHADRRELGDSSVASTLFIFD